MAIHSFKHFLTNNIWFLWIIMWVLHTLRLIILESFAHCPDIQNIYLSACLSLTFVWLMVANNYAISTTDCKYSNIKVAFHTYIKLSILLALSFIVVLLNIYGLHIHTYKTLLSPYTQLCGLDIINKLFVQDHSLKILMVYYWIW